ncbi:hypothetical protein HDU86_005987 [Geranomyces michiganensis]|nr:hypothetical protein HDU86_005987 [Geranomyces michiganensis]
MLAGASTSSVNLADGAEEPLVAKLLTVGARHAISFNVPTSLRAAWNAASLNKAAGSNAIYICLDVSGSMRGAPLRNASEGIHSLIAALAVEGHTDITLITFDTKAVVRPWTTLDQLDEILMRLSATAFGGTSFSAILDSISQHISKRDDLSAVTVVFFTDGQDGRGGVPQALAACQKSLRGRGSAIHCIGFTNNHDAVLLNQICELGDSQGTFQFVPSAEAIGGAVTELKDVLLEVYKRCVCLLGERAVNVSINTISGAATLVLDDAIIDSKIDSMVFWECDSAVAASDGEPPLFTYRLQRLSDAEMADPAAIELACSIVSTQLHEQAARVFVRKPKAAVLTSALAVIRDVFAVLKDLMQHSMRVVKKKRHACVQRCLEILALTDGLHARIAQARRAELSNAQIAEWRDLSTRPRLTSRRHNKELDKRALANVSLLDSTADKIKSIVAAMQWSAVRKMLPAEVAETCVCVSSMVGVDEALREGDCLAISLSVRRSEATIFDPTQLIVDSVGPTWMTVDTFFDTIALAKAFAENSNSMATPLKASASPQSAAGDTSVATKMNAMHGGFDRSAAGSLFFGNAGENINAVLPLYLSPHHWEVARLKLKAVVAYTTTLDVLGFASAQELAVPLLVWLRAASQARETGTDNARFIRDQVFKTCTAIYETRRDTREQFTARLAAYLAGPAGRTIDEIPHTGVFIATLLCAQAIGDVTLDAKQVAILVDGMVEETVRRGLKYHENATAFKGRQVFNVDEKAFIADPVRKWKDSLADNQSSLECHVYRAEFAKAATAGIDANVSDFRPTIPSRVIDAFVPSDNHFSTLSSAAEQFTKAVRGATDGDVQFLLETLRTNLAASEAAVVPTSVDDWYARFSPTTILAVHIQARSHRENSARREAIERDKYTEILGAKDTSAAGTAYLTRLLTAYVEKAKQRHVNDFLARQAALASNRAAALFASEGTDHAAAAGILLAHSPARGFHAFQAFISLFTTTEYVPAMCRDLGKLKMLVDGTFEGVKLRTREERPRWTMSRKNAYRVWKTFAKADMDKEAWRTLIGDYAELITFWKRGGRGGTSTD